MLGDYIPKAKAQRFMPKVNSTISYHYENRWRFIVLNNNNNNSKFIKKKNLQWLSTSVALTSCSTIPLPNSSVKPSRTIEWSWVKSKTLLLIIITFPLIFFFPIQTISLARSIKLPLAFITDPTTSPVVLRALSVVLKASSRIFPIIFFPLFLLNEEWMAWKMWISSGIYSKNNVIYVWKLNLKIYYWRENKNYYACGLSLVVPNRLCMIRKLSLVTLFCIVFICKMIL